MSWYQKLHWQIILSLLSGVVYGIVAAAAGWGEFTADRIQPFGTIFINSLQLIAVPLVIASLVTGVASLSDLRKLSRIGGKTIFIYVTTTAISVTIGLLIVNTLRPGDRVPEEVQARLEGAFAAGVAAADQAKKRGPLQIFVDMVPANFFGAVSANRNMLFRVERHLLQARHYRELRDRAFIVWHEVTCAA